MKKDSLYNEKTLKYLSMDKNRARTGQAGTGSKYLKYSLLSSGPQDGHGHKFTG